MRTTATTFCRIQEVSLAHTPHGVGLTVTVADQEGTTVTLALQPHDLATYARFQAAVLRETDCYFRYLPWAPHDSRAGQSQPTT